METSFDQIKMLNLTEDDFTLLVDGLDALPEKGLAGDIMGDLLVSMLSKGDDDAKQKMLADREEKQKVKEKAKFALKENVKILQGKLLMLKRFLQENGALKEAYEVLGIPKG